MGGAFQVLRRHPVDVVFAVVDVADDGSKHSRNDDDDDCDGTMERVRMREKNLFKFIDD